MGARHIDAWELLVLGDRLRALLNPHSDLPGNYRNSIEDFVCGLTKCGCESTLAAAQSLREASFSIDPIRDQIVQGDQARLCSMARMLLDSLEHELKGQEAIIVDNVVDSVRQCFSRFGHNGLSDCQQATLEDTIACLKTGLYRLAIVTAWSLGYDLIRTWVFENPGRKMCFNKLMLDRTEKHKGGARSIQVYEDFFREGESFVLQICRDAEGDLAVFTTKTHRQLERLLDDRNSFAHANDRKATKARAMGFIEQLLDELIDLFGHPESE